MLIDRVKLIIGIDILDDSKDELLAEIIANQTNIVNLYVGVTTLPTELEFVVVETSIARYNRKGSEGSASEGYDSVSYTYTDDIMTPYLPYLELYKGRNVTPRRLRAL